MGKQDWFTDEFKQDAVAQVVEHGHLVSEVAQRLGISTKSLYTWKALAFEACDGSKQPSRSDDRTAAGEEGTGSRHLGA